MRILLTGGSGLLGRELQKLERSIFAPGREQFDLFDAAGIVSYLDNCLPDLIVHAAAITRIDEVMKNPDKAVAVNVAGTAVIASWAAKNSRRLIYLSTDYVYPGNRDGLHNEDDALSPANLYAWTKLGGECAVRAVENSLVIRTSFGPRPFEYAVAAVDKITSRLYVDKAAPIILKLALSDEKGVINVGDKPRSMIDYARETRPDVQEITLAELGHSIPRNSALDITRLKHFLSNR